MEMEICLAISDGFTATRLLFPRMVRGVEMQMRISLESSSEPESDPESGYRSLMSGGVIVCIPLRALLMAAA